VTDQRYAEADSPASGLTKRTGELTQQSADEQARSRELFEITTNLLPKFGIQWNMHNLVSLRRQSLSRVLYYDGASGFSVGSYVP
jgi:hypothetical protein